MSSRWCPNLIDLFNVSLSAGGAAEGSQGQARSEAERAALDLAQQGSSTTSLRALKGRQKFAEDYCRNETNPREAQQTLLVWMQFSHRILSVLLSPFQGLVSITYLLRKQASKEGGAAQNYFDTRQ